MTITGEMLIGASAHRGGQGEFRAVDPATGEALEPAFGGGGAAEVERACALAWAAFDGFRETGLEQRATFLETVAQNILDIGDDLITRAMAESGLPRARLEGERGRTVGQLRLFAQVVREGSWIEARIDPALPARTPLPRPDIRQRHIPLGPVAVFGASNFPLAFSVAGGDTASAFAAGCPVVVKGHGAHPGFIPDVFGTTGFHTTTLLLSIATPAILIAFSVAARIRRHRFAIEQEPLVLFLLKSAGLFAVVAYVGWLLATYKGLPNVLIIMALLIGLYAFVTRDTTIGRRIYALGGNEKAAKLSGIDTRRLSFYTFVNMGVLAALAGLIFAARLNTATPKAGVSFELDVIAACFIGGASASGGVGRVTGAVIGAFIMGVMNNGMSIVGIGIDWQQVIKGLVLLAAVCFDVYNKGKA